MRKEEIIHVLQKIIVPETGKNIISSELLKQIHIINDHSIEIELITNNPTMHAKKGLSDAINFHLNKKFGENINVKINFQTIKKNESRKVLPEVKNIICIASGKGGVGKSTVTMNIAASLDKLGFSVGVIDADIYGPSVPTMTGTEGGRPEMTEVGGVKLIKPLISQGIKIMSIGYFTDPSNAVVWRGPMASKALNQMVMDVHWGELDFLLVDLPPGTGDIHLSLIQNVPVDAAIIISTPQEVALADARRGIKMFQLESVNIPILGMVENMSWFTPQELPNNRYYIFGRDGVKNLASGLEIAFLGEIPLLEGLRESCDSGLIGVLNDNTVQTYFKEIAKNVLNQLSLIKKDE